MAAAAMHQMLTTPVLQTQLPGNRGSAERAEAALRRAVDQARAAVAMAEASAAQLARASPSSGTVASETTGSAATPLSTRSRLQSKETGDIAAEHAAASPASTWSRLQSKDAADIDGAASPSSSRSRLPSKDRSDSKASSSPVKRYSSPSILQPSLAHVMRRRSQSEDRADSADSATGSRSAAPETVISESRLLQPGSRGPLSAAGSVSGASSCAGGASSADRPRSPFRTLRAGSLFADNARNEENSDSKILSPRASLQAETIETLRDKLRAADERLQVVTAEAAAARAAVRLSREQHEEQTAQMQQAAEKLRKENLRLEAVVQQAGIEENRLIEAIGAQPAKAEQVLASLRAECRLLEKENLKLEQSMESGRAELREVQKSSNRGGNTPTRKRAGPARCATTTPERGGRAVQRHGSTPSLRAARAAG
eukprot:gnl/TRDRNA2_/TRDRNA2_83208_c0_seq1.p1 gnl/TRDRNA2_/TRDRNA2_83208_c0~~gnl/TRDRNA2_/TRDRNA2_83208_c0_seq1.p1  ORF type:complete len:428 (+),score=80.84 gnl/TRDRNA2_/TRDRNA2_83208_c0_seq1:74-1357(+)